uniref:Uncharacterized protein n=1 Tax=Meloidogyne enterolobii TaxID=390850 RepID=A0A6V7TW77_MELEN|nr:unnamed protein product [Meloidogyne enterolobii]
MSKLFFPLFFIVVSIYFVNTSSNSQSTITSLHTKNNFSRNNIQNSGITKPGASGIVQPDSERSVNQPDNHHQPPVDNQHLNHLLGHALGYDRYYNNY